MKLQTIILKDHDFLKGNFEGTMVTADFKLILEKNKTKGVFESDIIDTIVFKDLVASWNGKTSENSSIELQVKIKGNDMWSKWFTYGKWSDKGNNIGSKNKQQDNLGKVKIDVIKTQPEVKGTGLKFRIILNRTDINFESPNVRLLAFTFSPYIVNNTKDFEACEIDIDVPKRSQMTIPDIGKVICSPTSVSMIMEYFGFAEETVTVANGCKDNGIGIYGNWSYNMAYAGERGFDAYVRRCESINDIKEEIIEGIPVVASIKTSTADELEGAPQAYKSGHLLVVRGFTKKDGEEYIIVNDPAAREKETVRREYKLNQFMQAWSKIIYVIILQQT